MFFQFCTPPKMSSLTPGVCLSQVEDHWSRGNSIGSYSGRELFEPRHGNWLTWLNISFLFLPPPPPNANYCGHGRNHKFAFDFAFFIYRPLPPDTLQIMEEVTKQPRDSHWHRSNFSTWMQLLVINKGISIISGTGPAISTAVIVIWCKCIWEH
jgi:hypothetical protein